jgi:ribosomal protein L37AE/L43A
MPYSKVEVREHDRRRPNQATLTHIESYAREQETGAAPRETFPTTIEEVMIEEVQGEIEECSICHRKRPVYNRDISGRPQCQECHFRVAKRQMERRQQRKKDTKALEKRWASWPM